MAIFSIPFIFSVVSTFVFSNRANILDKALKKRFSSLLPATSSSNSSWSESDTVDRISNTPSVESLLSASLSKNVSSSRLTSSRIVSVPAIVPISGSPKNKWSADSPKFFVDILFLTLFCISLPEPKKNWFFLGLFSLFRSQVTFFCLYGKN